MQIELAKKALAGINVADLVDVYKVVDRLVTSLLRCGADFRKVHLLSANFDDVQAEYMKLASTDIRSKLELDARGNLLQLYDACGKTISDAITTCMGLLSSVRTQFSDFLRADNAYDMMTS